MASPIPARSGAAAPGEWPTAAAKKTTARNGGERGLNPAERRGRRSVHDASERGETAGSADEQSGEAEVEDGTVRTGPVGPDRGQEHESGGHDDAGQDQHGTTGFFAVAPVPPLRYPRP